MIGRIHRRGATQGHDGDCEVRRWVLKKALIRVFIFQQNNGDNKLVVSRYIITYHSHGIIYNSLVLL